MATGLQTSSTLSSTNKYVEDSFAASLVRLQPNGQTPLFGLTSRIPSETAVQVEHGYWTKTQIFPGMKLTAAVADGAATTFTVASTTNLLPGMLMQAWSTKEIVIINTIASATSVTVTRGIGGGAAAIANSVDFYQVGNAYEEASARPQALSTSPVYITNLTQIFRNSWALSGTAAATQVTIGDQPIAESRMECANYHAISIEQALIFGKKSQGTRNGQPFRTMDGLINIVSNLSYYPPSYSAANVYTAAATTNYTQIENMLEPCFNQSTDNGLAPERILFGGAQAMKVINQIGRLSGNYQLEQGQTDYGLQFRTFKTTRGSFSFIEHSLFNSNPNYSKLCLALDLSSFRVAYLGGRKTKREEYNLEGTPVDNGIDAVGGTLTTEMTLVIKNPPANAVIYDLTAGAAG